MMSDEMPVGNRYLHPSFAFVSLWRCVGEIWLEKAISDCVFGVLSVIPSKYGQGLMSLNDFALKTQKLLPGRKQQQAKPTRNSNLFHSLSLQNYFIIIRLRKFIERLKIANVCDNKSSNSAIRNRQQKFGNKKIDSGMYPSPIFFLRISGQLVAHSFFSGL